jgi:hypothetical protein
MDSKRVSDGVCRAGPSESFPSSAALLRAWLFSCSGRQFGEPPQTHSGGIGALAGEAIRPARITGHSGKVLSKESSVTIRDNRDHTRFLQKLRFDFAIFSLEQKMGDAPPGAPPMLIPPVQNVTRIKFARRSPGNQPKRPRRDYIAASVVPPWHPWCQEP